MSSAPNQPNEPVYVISVAARLAGLPLWVLRVLDQEGVVVPVRTDSNRRLYCDADIALLARVRHLTEERGVNIPGVKVILEMEREHARHTAPTPPPSPAATEPSPVRAALLPVPVLASSPANGTTNTD